MKQKAETVKQNDEFYFYNKMVRGKVGQRGAVKNENKFK